MSTVKLSPWEFGERLIESGDLDPVYVLLWNTEIDNLRKWLLAYWCFYHVGTASWIVDQPDYWQAMETAAGSKEYPRSSERRHFRGRNAANSVSYLKVRGIPSLFAKLRGTVNASEVVKEVGSWVGFGPWISFKVADMLDRLGKAQVEFDDAAILMFDSPAEGCRLMHANYGQGPFDAQATASDLIDRLKHLTAPPRHERPINIQEAETVFCKWKSYMRGHYEIGEDVQACVKSLKRFPESETGSNLLATCENLGWV